MHRWTMFVLFCCASVLGVILLLNLPGKEGGDHELVDIFDVELNAAAAESVYQAQCISCHGAEFEGGAGPGLQTVGASMTKEAIYKQISGGGGGMPPYKDRLSDEEIVNLTLWFAEMK